MSRAEPGLGHGYLVDDHRASGMGSKKFSDLPLTMRREAAHASVTVVVHRLVDLGPRVHHKRPLANDRFLDRLPIEKQKGSVLQRLDRKRFILAVEDGQFGRAR